MNPNPSRQKRRRSILGRKGLLVCVCLGLLVGGAMLWTHIGPGIKPLPRADTPANRNVIRQVSVQQIAQALVAYVHANNSVPFAIPDKSTQICTTMGTDCSSMHLADISYLMTEGDYIPGIPEDPLGGLGDWGSGFYIAKLSNGQIQISAPKAELGQTIKYVTSL